MGVEILPQEGALLRGMMWRFSCTLPSTVPSGPDIKVSPHAVHQHSGWPAADTVKCHIKFSQWNIPRNAASRKYSLTACLYLQSNDKDMLTSWYSAHFLTTQNSQWLSNQQWLCTTLFMYTTLQPLSNCCTNASRITFATILYLASLWRRVIFRWENICENKCHNEFTC